MTLEYKLLGINEVVSAEEINGLIYFRDDNDNAIQIKTSELEKLIIAINRRKDDEKV